MLTTEFVTSSVPTERGTSNGRNSPQPRDAQVGDLSRIRDAPSLFGTSHFEPQAAAKAIKALAQIYNQVLFTQQAQRTPTVMLDVPVRRFGILLACYQGTKER